METSSAVVFFVFLASVGDCAKILGVFPSPGYSQFILTERLMTALATRGHEVTVVCPFAPKNPHKNYRTILAGNLAKDRGADNKFHRQNNTEFTNIKNTYLKLGFFMTEYLLSAEPVQKFLKSNNETFDLVIVEQFLNEAHMGFAAHFRAPLIMFSSVKSSEWIDFLVGNPSPPSYVPHSFMGYTSQMNFVERIWNTVFYAYDLALKYLLVWPHQEKLLRKYFSEDLSLSDLIRNVSLVLVNSHPAITEPLPLAPNMIEIGGFHVDPKPLSKNLKDYLDAAEEGAIFFSMGTNIRINDLPDELKRSILRVFSRLKQKVLWKFDEEDFPGKPENVKIGKWLPQSSILEHPNTKLFISHCGFLSTIETVYSAVPVICIPIFCDQRMNAANLEKRGLSVTLPYKNLSEETLAFAIDEILKNDNYAKNMLEKSQIFKDNPVKPLDNAIFWIEYTIRHKGVSHLHSASYDIPWYQYLLLDIITTAFLVICVLRLIYKKLARFIICRQKHGEQAKQKIL